MSLENVRGKNLGRSDGNGNAEKVLLLFRNVDVSGLAHNGSR